MKILKKMLEVQEMGGNCAECFVNAYNEHCLSEHGDTGLLEYGTVFDGHIAEDSDLEDAFIVFGIECMSLYPYLDKIDEIEIKGKYWSEDDFQDIYYLTDGEVGVFVAVKIIENRHGSSIEETFLDMRYLVETERIETCDNCKSKMPLELMENVDGNQENLDLPLAFQNGFDGMICLKCKNEK